MQNSNTKQEICSHLISNSSIFVNNGNKLKIPIADKRKNKIAFSFDFDVNKAEHIIGIKMAFSCT